MKEFLDFQEVEAFLGFSVLFISSYIALWLGNGFLGGLLLFRGVIGNMGRRIRMLFVTHYVISFCGCPVST